MNLTNAHRAKYRLHRAKGCLVPLRLQICHFLCSYKYKYTAAAPHPIGPDTRRISRLVPICIFRKVEPAKNSNLDAGTEKEPSATCSVMECRSVPVLPTYAQSWCVTKFLSLECNLLILVCCFAARTAATRRRLRCAKLCFPIRRSTNPTRSPYSSPWLYSLAPFACSAGLYCSV